MTAAGGCDDVRPELGVYLLGAVEPADRRLIDRHLAGCAACRSELAGLAALPALLGKVSADEVVAADASGQHEEPWPSRDVLRSQLARAARIRRHRLGAWVGAAAVVGAMAGSAAVAIFHARQISVRPAVAREHASSRPPVSPPAAGGRFEMAARATEPGTGASATVRYSPEAWGLVLAVRVDGIPAGFKCRLEVLDSLGHATIAGGWTVAGQAGTWYPGSSAVSLADLRGFVVVSGSKILVKIHVDGRAQLRRRRQLALAPHDRRLAPQFGQPRPRRAVHRGGDSYDTRRPGPPGRGPGPGPAGCSGYTADVVPGGVPGWCGCPPAC
jgi:hypothetical protein